MRQTVDIKEIEKIKEILEKDDNVVFALLFGSYASGRQKKGSDIDIAVYLKNRPSDLLLFKLSDKFVRPFKKRSGFNSIEQCICNAQTSGL